MSRDANVIGRNVARLRYQRGWSQDELVTQLQLVGNINMTRDILANIETLRSPADSKQIEFFAEVFRIPEQALFPKQRHFVAKEVGMELREFTRRRAPAPLDQK
jgi:transcriptional regulator with XRE-family HTH domain